MSDKVKKYWLMRCARWGDFEISGRGFSGTNWHRLINGTPHNQLNDDTVRDLSEQVETAVFIRHLDPQKQALARAAFAGGSAHQYGMSTKQLGEVFLNCCVGDLERMRKQRLNGEPIDPSARRPRLRTSMVKINNRRAAAVSE